MNWTPQEDAILKKMRADGVSFGVIAKRIGRPRNALIGRANRLGLPRVLQPKVRGQRTHAPWRPRLSASSKARPRPIIKQREPEPAYTGAPVRFMDLRAGYGQCRMIIGETAGPDTLFCGAPAEGAYCAVHARRAYLRSCASGNGAATSARP